MVGGLRVGELSAKSGIGRKALRLYEARRILPTPPRTPAGYRLYPPGTLEVLTFVSRARRLGLTLAEIAHIVALPRAGSPPCVHVRRLLEQKASDLEGMLRELRQTLNTWRATDGRTATICPHIERKGGEVIWKGSRSRSVRTVSTVQKSSSRVARSRSVKMPIRPS
jgi:MerR family copper efflux transcriptional regulator